MLLSYNNSMIIVLFYGVLLTQCQTVQSDRNSATTNITSSNVLSLNNNKVDPSININRSLVEDDYFKDLMENLNYLKENVKLEPQEEDTLRASEIPTQLKVSDIQASKYYARLAGAAYCNDTNLEAWSCSHCKEIPIQHVATYNDKTTESKAYLAVDKNKEVVVLSFRGSSTLRNFIQDAKVFKDSIALNNKEYKVHRGFKQCTDSLLPLYIDRLKESLNKHKHYKLVVVGHSLGGAISVLSALMLRQRLGLKDERLEVFTYGQPRIGDEEFAHYLNQQTFTLTRAVNSDDIVPHLPPQLKFVSNYYHHHHEIWINGNKDIYCNNDYLEDPNCSASKWYTPSVEDHLNIWGIKLGGIC
ncbi:alpha/beta-hydrolase [Neoconidiobolus thromboides FSU 785]|nr:alpha/beta-hydrolase [Neoconidiobolus thromboides FSU 785]